MNMFNMRAPYRRRLDDSSDKQVFFIAFFGGLNLIVEIHWRQYFNWLGRGCNFFRYLSSRPLRILYI